MTQPNILGITPNNTTEQNKEIDQFREFLADENTHIPMGSNFVIRFNNVPAVLRDNRIVEFEKNWNVIKTQEVLQKYLIDKNMFFVNGITLPTESVGVGRVGMAELYGEHSGGLLSGMVSKSRTQQGALNISFLETNKSFIDFVIRPWVTLVSHYGLCSFKRVNEPLDPIKTTISAVFYSLKEGSEDSRLRKHFKFFDCAPVGIDDGGTFSYGDTSVRIVKTSWAYSKYSIQDV